jgi:hypothetical protein
MQTVRGSFRLVGGPRRDEKLTSRFVFLMWAAVVTQLLGACGSGEETPRRQSATATPTRQVSAAPTPTDLIATDPEPTVELLREWVAVFRVAEARDPDLQDETQELLRLVPMNIAISPVGCWVGLLERLGNPQGESLYVSAVVAESRQELGRVVGKVGREPILQGEFPAMCGHVRA